MEVLLGVEPFPQPAARRDPGGDCFACALTAALRHLYPTQAPAFDRVWDYWREKGREDASNDWYGMRRALFAARADGLPLEFYPELVAPRFDVEHFDHCFAWQPDDGRYTRHLEAFLAAGWIAFTVINFDGTGPVTESKGRSSADHWVILDGAQSTWEDGALRHQIHVVCSVKGAYWTPTLPFLMQHGGAGWWLVRKDQR